MKKLYRFDFDCGRQGSLYGTFVADEKDIANAIGKRMYFGEVLGKHSDISGNLDEEEHLYVVTDDQDFVEKFEKFNCDSGYNPLNYIRSDKNDKS